MTSHVCRNQFTGERWWEMTTDAKITYLLLFTLTEMEAANCESNVNRILVALCVLLNLVG